MATSDVIETVADASCYLCLSDKELAAATLGLLSRILQNLDPMADVSPTQLMADAACFMCLEPKQMAAIQLQLLVVIAASGGVTCGNGDPVADPGVACRLYYNRTNSSLWYWDDVLGTWLPLVV